MGLYEMYFEGALRKKPYGTDQEYWGDLYARLDMELSVLCAYRLRPPEEKGALSLKESVVAGLVTDRQEALELLGLETPRRERGGDGAQVRRELVRAQAHVMDRLVATSRSGTRLGLRNLSAAFGLNKLGEFLLILSMAVYYDAKYEIIFSYLQGEGKSCPTIRLALSLYELTSAVSMEDREGVLEGRGPLFDYLLSVDSVHRGHQASRMFVISGRVYGFLLGQAPETPALEGIASLYLNTEPLEPVLIRRETAEQMERLIQACAVGKEEGCRVVNLWGEPGNGRRFLVKHGAKKKGWNVLFVEVSRLIDTTMAETAGAVKALIRESILTHSLLCFLENEYREEDEEESLAFKPFPPALGLLLELLSERCGFFFWLTKERAGYLTRYPLEFAAVESPMLTVGERIVLWQEYARAFRLEEGADLLLYANQYILTAKGIRDVLGRGEMLRAGRNAPFIRREDLMAAVKQQSVNQLGRYATLINAVFTWEDLIIDEEQKRQMQMICNQVRYRSVVGEEWGFHRKTPYGQGICAMFYGSPGTGKTMAVQVMANELGLDLYRIDLSQMVSKYIGETEKNISSLFRKARNINALLFFDEADSMFAKRSEVKDSNDRNANAETAHLLQKLEDYSGITILATNYVNNIDDAFKRRIKFMVHFVFPPEQVRYKLWTSILPKKVPCEEEIDFEFFARNFELSGSNIKEVLTNAAYIAAASHRGLLNADLVEAVKLNFAKYGKILTAGDFGYLGQ